MINLLDEYYKKLHNALAPIASYLLCLVPFGFLYLTAKDTILIEESILIPIAVGITALVTVSNPGIGFLPCGALVFLCLWQQNFYVAIAAAILFLIATIQTGNKRKARYIFPLLVMILCAGKYNSLKVLMICFMLTSTIYWGGKRDNIFIIPSALLLNQILFGTGSQIDGIGKILETENRIPLLSYFQKTYAIIEAEDHYGILLQALKDNFIFYAIFFCILLFVSAVLSSVNGKLSKTGEFRYVLGSQVLASLIFTVAHFAANLSLGSIPDVKEYLLALPLCLLISIVLGLLVDVIYVEIKDEISTKKVFISYSHKDIDTTKGLCKELENRGIGCWYAPRDIPPGKEWASAIVDAINEVDVLALIFTDNSNASVQVQREVDQAIARKIKVVPIKLTNSNPSGGMSYYLSTLQWLDGRHKSIENIAVQMIQMINK